MKHKSLHLNSKICSNICPEEFKKATITVYFGFVFDKPRSGKSHAYRDVIVFEKLRFQHVRVRPHENEKPASSNSSGLKSVF